MSLDNPAPVIGSVVGLTAGFSGVVVLFRRGILGPPGSWAPGESWSDLSWEKKLALRATLFGSIPVGLIAAYWWLRLLPSFYPWPIAMVSGLAVYFGAMITFIFLLFRSIFLPHEEG